MSTYVPNALFLFRALLHTIETIVIEWSNQIRHVLKEDSSQLLVGGGNNPCPDVEINFWNKKYDNLKSMYTQVNITFSMVDICLAVSNGEGIGSVILLL